MYKTKFVIRGLATLAALSLAAGCAEKDFTNDDAANANKDNGGVTQDVGLLDDLYPSGPVEISGKVLAPNGKMPVSGALVYVAAKEPTPIPQNVFCDKCVELPKSTPHVKSSPDGSFKLQVPFKGKWMLVTQKGAFRRARWITVPETAMKVPQDMTTLPAKTDAAKGDFIPKMAVIEGAWDAIQKSLAKLGLGQVDKNGSVVPGTESFARYKCKLVSLIPPKLDCKPKHPGEFLKDYAELSKYHIIFSPCDSEWLDGYYSDKKVKENLLKWIKAGGRLYATDYNYDVLHEILPGYITWEGQSKTMGSAELQNSYNAPAVVKNKDLKAWLLAQNVASFKLLDSYTIIKSLNKKPAPDPDDKTHDVLPEAWIYANLPSKGLRPATVSYPYGCGRILFSTYHTEGDKSSPTSLLPQERALLYVILEVAVCLKDPKVQ